MADFNESMSVYPYVEYVTSNHKGITVYTYVLYVRALK